MKRLIVLIFAVAMSQSVLADDVSDAISAALESYKAGDTSSALTSLDLASLKLRSMKSESIAKLMPEALEGWTVVETNKESHAASAYGGMVLAGKSYEKTGSDLSIVVMTDSPLVQSTAMMFANPMMVKLSGDKMLDINGQKAILHLIGGTGSIHILLESRILITVDGNNVKQEELEKYASGINFDELIKL